MKRRKAIKAFIIGTASTGMLLKACSIADKKENIKQTAAVPEDDRMPEEVAYNNKLKSETFFTSQEIATIAALTDIIIPKDEISGSATDAKVPEFIEFIAKDKPEHQTPLRGGLRWLDMVCLKKFERSFIECSDKQKLEIVTKIAYPKKNPKELQQGIPFFSLVRNLTISGFYTTEIGFKDIGYKGNVPNQWNGVPDDVLQQYNLSYTEKELQECIR